MSNGIRNLIANMPASKIREVAELGMGAPDVLPFWFGESDEPTPDFIKDAAKDALDKNYTYYSQNNGLPPLREALSAYMTNLYNTPIHAGRITASASGMQAIMLTMQALVDVDDEVITVGPIWPNIPCSAAVLGGKPVEVSLRENDGKWHLDMDELIDAITKKTKAVIINSPANPTGWMMKRADQITLLDHCRKLGIWIICDDVYARMVYERRAAPSFIEIATPEDRVIALNSFSKTWNMTGWRLGWITAPAFLSASFAMLNEFNTVAPTSFVQIAGIAALEKGEDFVAKSTAALKTKRDLLCQRLGECKSVRISPPEATFYGFFAIDGMKDSLATAKKILTETKVGLAPGIAFGKNAEGYLRFCFATSDDLLVRALDRLVPFIESEFN